MPFTIEFGLNYGLGLGRIDCIAIEISSSHNPSLALSSSVSSCHKGDIIGRRSNRSESNVDET